MTIKLFPSPFHTAHAAEKRGGREQSLSLRRSHVPPLAEQSPSPSLSFYPSFLEEEEEQPNPSDPFHTISSYYPKLLLRRRRRKKREKLLLCLSFFHGKRGSKKEREVEARAKHNQSVSRQSNWHRKPVRKRKGEKIGSTLSWSPSAQVTKHKGEKLSYFERKRKNE